VTTRQPIRGLGEIALRVRNLEAMTAFYRDVIGLIVMRESQSSVFFRIADGVEGHTQALVLFDQSVPPFGVEVRARVEPRAETSTLHHVALAISRDDYETELERLEGLGFAVMTAEHAWAELRSLYVSDPEGNVVELVCFHPAD